MKKMTYGELFEGVHDGDIEINHWLFATLGGTVADVSIYPEDLGEDSTRQRILVTDVPEEVEFE